MGHPVVHFELSGADQDGKAKFYADLLGWHANPMPDGSYVMLDTRAGSGINGGLGPSADGRGHVIFYVEADDLQPVLDRAVELGGKVAREIVETPMVTYAALTDPAGNTIGIVKSEPDQEGPPVSPGDGAAVGWWEVLGPDAPALWSFYRELFGWTLKESSGQGFQYAEVDTGTGDRGIPGGIGSSPDGQAMVSVYASVDDLQKTLDRAEELGGTTIMPPMAVMGGTSIAHLADPHGTRLGLYRSSQS